MHPNSTTSSDPTKKNHKPRQTEIERERVYNEHHSSTQHTHNGGERTNPLGFLRRVFMAERGNRKNADDLSVCAHRYVLIKDVRKLFIYSLADGRLCFIFIFYRECPFAGVSSGLKEFGMKIIALHYNRVNRLHIRM